ncbi:hypothetical protein ACFWN2_17065 [Lentzea sp. NPDC058436]|uniref:hypothetical protein n=1 Tax=Lentzea sp. NPDC058436 TaxID=3346499 RepID=UPI00366124DA
MSPVVCKEKARASATRAATTSRVRVRMLDTISDCAAAERLLCEVWRTGPDQPPLAADVVKAMADAGSHVAGAFDTAGDDLVGVCVGLWGPPDRPGMHSHLAGVLGSARGRHVGLALKLDQRAHALERGTGRISWTFDPLIARNAHFNLTRLGGTVSRYLPDYYGRLPDGLNQADESDRLMLDWDLADPRVVAACDEARPEPPGPTPLPLLADDGGRPVSRRTSGGPVLVAVPEDFETLRAEQPSLAREWRVAVRHTLGALLDGGARLTRFDRAAGGYVLTTGEGR